MADLTRQISQCCYLEKERLVKESTQRDFCTTSYEAFHQCYRDAARESGKWARSCMTA
jgi:hypothetical protein